MLSRVTAVLAAITFCLAAEEGPRGIPARPTPADYAAKAQWRHATFAASLVPMKQAEHLFAFDISKTYLIFEVACYADNSAAVRLSRESFVLKVDASGDSVRHAEAETVASAIQRQNLPPMPSGHHPSVGTGVTVGYEHGTDRYSGRPVNGVYTAAQVTVEGGGSQVPPPQGTKPGGSYEDRKMLEAQLSAHSLPEGSVDRAVAGYLFFRKADLKAKAGDVYALEYLADEDGSGATNTVVIAVPKKPH